MSFQGPVKVKEFGCYVWLDGESLMECEINTFEEALTRVMDCGEITAPDSQKFLDIANSHFGTTFQMNEFAGR